jgi:hypothetical protein
VRWLLLLLAVVEIYRLIPPLFPSAIQEKSHIYMSSPEGGGEYFNMFFFFFFLSIFPLYILDNVSRGVNF